MDFSNRIKDLLNGKRPPSIPNLHRTTYPEALDGTFHATVKEACNQSDKLDKLVNDMKLISDVKKYVEEKDTIGMTPFHTAAYFRSVEVCKILLRHNGDLNGINNFGYTPLFIALGANQDIELGTWLLENGADPTIRAQLEDDSTWTVFHAVSLLKNESIMMLLVKYGANPTSPYTDGTVALTYERYSKRRELICQLSRRYNRRIEKLDAYCSWCGKNPQKLQRCSGCYVVFYCNKECQNFDWKFCHGKTCKKPLECGEKLHEIIGLKQSGDYVTPLPPFKYLEDSSIEQEMDAWRTNKKAFKKAVGKHFVVAVQNCDEYTRTMVIHNQDYSIHTKVYHTCSNAAILRKLLRDCTDLNKGLYLWATPCDPDKCTLYVYPGKFAPQQEWPVSQLTAEEPKSE